MTKKGIGLKKSEYFFVSVRVKETESAKEVGIY
jgi:methionine salvage enolase-phosphatase E1